MKSILKRLYLLLVLSVGFNLQTRAQLLANPSVYRNIVSYIKKDSTYCDDSLINCHNKKIAVSAFIVKTKFAMAEDVNPMHLNLENMDSLDRVLCLYDNEANAGYKPQTEKKLTLLSTSGKPEFMLYFSRRYKNMVYAEIYPTWNLRERKFDYSKFYPVNYQGGVMAYAFTLKDDKIIAVRKGMYFCD